MSCNSDYREKIKPSSAVYRPVRELVYYAVSMEALLRVVDPGCYGSNRMIHTLRRYICPHWAEPLDDISHEMIKEAAESYYKDCICHGCDTDK